MLRKKWFPPLFFLILAVGYFIPYLGLNQIVMGSDDGTRGWFAVGNKSLHAISSYFDRWSPLNGGTAIMERRFGRFINPVYFIYDILPKYKARYFEYIFWIFVAGMGMFLFLRTLDFSRSLSYFGAIGFVLSPGLLSFIYAGHFARMEVVALLPLMLFFVERMLRQFKWINLAGLPIVMALAVYSEHLQLAYFSFLGAGFYFAARMLYMFFCKEIPLSQALKRTSMFAAAMVFACLLTAMNIFPSMSNTSETSKRAGGVDYNYAASFSLHPEELFSLLEPDFAGWREKYWGQNTLKLNSEYFGVIFIILAALLFVFEKPRFFHWMLVGFIIASTLFSLGAHTPFHRLVYETLPGIKSFRAPGMMFIWFWLPTLVLGLMGLRKLLQMDLRNDAVLRKRFWVFSGIVIGLCAVYMIFSGSIAQNWFQGMGTSASQNQNKLNAFQANLDSLKTGAFLIFLFVSASLVVLYFTAIGSIGKKTGLCIVLIILCFDLLRISRPYIASAIQPTAPVMQQELAENSISDFIRSHDPTSSFRVYSMLGDPKQYFNGLDMAYMFDDFIDKRYNELSTQLQMYSYYLKQSQGNLESQAIGPFVNLCNILNIKYLVTMETIPSQDLRPIASNGSLTIYENTGAFSRFYLSATPEKSAEPLKTLTGKIQSQHLSAPPCILQANSAITLDTTRDTTISDSIRVVTYSPPKGIITLDVQSSRQQILVVSENNVPGWSCTISGKPAKIISVNYLWKGVVVPRGRSTVEWNYISATAHRWRTVTFISSILFGIFCIVVVLIELRKQPE